MWETVLPTPGNFPEPGSHDAAIIPE